VPGSGAAFSLLPPDNASGNFTRIVQRVPVKVRLRREGALAGRIVPGLSATVFIDGRATNTNGEDEAGHPVPAAGAR
jgi:multidrug resistance efflux pump